MAVILSERGLIAVRVESTKGTANAPAAADAGIEVYDVSYTPEIGVHERDPVRPGFDTEKNIVGPRSARITFRTPMKGTGAAGERPEFYYLLRGCGLSETITAATRVDYDPISAESAQETLTIDVYHDGLRYRAVGCMGNARIVAKQGDTPHIEWEFRGVYVAPADVSLLTNPPYVTASPAAMISATLTFRSQTLRATGFELDLGNVVELREDVTNAAGYVNAYVARRDPTITCDPEVELVATFDFLTSLINATAGAFTAQWGSAGGGQWRINCPNAQIVGADISDRNSLKIHNLTIKARALNPQSATGDSVSIRLS